MLPEPPPESLRHLKTTFYISGNRMDTFPESEVNKPILTSPPYPNIATLSQSYAHTLITSRMQLPSPSSLSPNADSSSEDTPASKSATPREHRKRSRAPVSRFRAIQGLGQGKDGLLCVSDQ